MPLKLTSNVGLPRLNNVGSATLESGKIHLEVEKDGKHGYEYIPLGMCSYKSENIGMTQGYYSNNTQQLDWWMHSKPHHDAILNANYTLTGVAVNGNKVVQHFCIAK
jgi:hypothetical protein